MGVRQAVTEAIEASRFGLMLLDDEGRVLHANQPACELVGRAEGELIGRPLWDFVHPDDRGWVIPLFELLLAGASDRVRREIRLISPDGGENWSELNARSLNGDSDRVAAVVLLEDASNRPLRERDLQRLADTDPLTDLLNRRRFATELDRHLTWARRYGARGALIVLDIDGLKAINDEHGHLGGDRAIQEVANLLRARTRSSDTVARLGGDEFAVLLPAASADQAVELARALLQGLRERTPHTSIPPLSLSIGITTVTNASDPTSLFGQADAALYSVKREGGNGYGVEPAEPIADARAEDDQLVLEPVPSDTEVTMRVLLETVADLGQASSGLVAWELYRTEQAVTPAWTVAVREGLVERTRYDVDDGDWQYRLTDAGATQLQLLKRDDADGQPAMVDCG